MIWPLNKKKCKKRLLSWACPSVKTSLQILLGASKKFQSILKKISTPSLGMRKNSYPILINTKTFRPSSIKSTGPSTAVIYDRSLIQLWSTEWHHFVFKQHKRTPLRFVLLYSSLKTQWCHTMLYNWTMHALLGLMLWTKQNGLRRIGPKPQTGCLP